MWTYQKVQMSLHPNHSGQWSITKWSAPACPMISRQVARACPSACVDFDSADWPLHQRTSHHSCLVSQTTVRCPIELSFNNTCRGSIHETAYYRFWLNSVSSTSLTGMMIRTTEHVCLRLNVCLTIGRYDQRWQCRTTFESVVFQK
jgi:hypothetical protein